MSCLSRRNSLLITPFILIISPIGFPPLPSPPSSSPPSPLHSSSLTEFSNLFLSIAAQSVQNTNEMENDKENG